MTAPQAMNGVAPSGRRRRWRAYLVRWAPFAVPVLYLALIFHLQPEDYLGPAEGAEWAHQRVFDDYDMTAIALRGLNATLGRSAGRTDVPDDIPEA